MEEVSESGINYDKFAKISKKSFNINEEIDKNAFSYLKPAQNMDEGLKNSNKLGKCLIRVDFANYKISEDKYKYNKTYTSGFLNGSITDNSNKKYPHGFNPCSNYLHKQENCSISNSTNFQQNNYKYCNVLGYDQIFNDIAAINLKEMKPFEIKLDLGVNKHTNKYLSPKKSEFPLKEYELATLCNKPDHVLKRNEECYSTYIHPKYKFLINENTNPYLHKKIQKIRIQSSKEKHMDRLSTKNSYNLMNKDQNNRLILTENIRSNRNLRSQSQDRLLNKEMTGSNFTFGDKDSLKLTEIISSNGNLKNQFTNKLLNKNIIISDFIPASRQNNSLKLTENISSNENLKNQFPNELLDKNIAISSFIPMDRSK